MIYLMLASSQLKVDENENLLESVLFLFIPQFNFYRILSEIIINLTKMKIFIFLLFYFFINL